ncbi:hypothetical protein [Hyalangium sp.]|uniref:hypothetical protein n=1 Tax=Hyalangium sp. TaxID=2028555 RepID=UPI002D5C1C96|nr:hypothetical protein [Hyalangium sp.]HYH95850.1 hypothetical protein [Hyalangium sp.]
MARSPAAGGPVEALGSEIVHIYLPIYGSCQAPCPATFNHLGRAPGPGLTRLLAGVAQARATRGVVAGLRSVW